MSTERRKSPRFTVNQMVEISFGRERYVQASGLNISRSGMLCATERYLEPTAQVELLMSLEMSKGSHRFGCEGIVVRSDETRHGFRSAISFSFLEDADSRKLNTFLRSRKAVAK